MITLNNFDITNALNKSLDELKSYQQKFFDSLQQRISNELLPKSDELNFNIFTALIPRNSFLIDFFPLDCSDNFVYVKSSIPLSVNHHSKSFDEPKGPFFLSCPYDKFQSFCLNTYEGKNFKYKLVPFYGFIDRFEVILFKLSQLYNIHRPLIFNPFARRAVSICILDDVDAVSFDDFQFNKNNLSDVLLLNSSLMWNIKKGPSSNILSGPLTDSSILQFTLDDIFILI